MQDCEKKPELLPPCLWRTSEQQRLKIFNTFSSLQLMMHKQFSQICFLCFYLAALSNFPLPLRRF